jgi:4-hydroxy-tetrahydrodipicolinate synthase
MIFIRGLAAFPITPADAEGRVDAPALRGLIRRLVEARVDSIGLLGSTGGYAYLTRDERRRAIDAAVAQTGGALPLVVGVGALRTDEAVHLALDAKAAGADAGLLAPVSYTPLLDDEVFTHFETVAAESDLPIVIYNNPGTTHFSFTPELIGRLSRVAGIVAVKNPAPEPPLIDGALAALRKLTPKSFSVGYSGDARGAEVMIAGADAFYSVAAGLFPVPMMEIRRAVAAGDAALARRLNAKLAPLWDLFQRFTGFRVVHTAAGMMKLSPHDPPRPILPLPDAARQDLGRVLSRLQLID